MTESIEINVAQAPAPAMRPRNYRRLCRVLCTAMAVFFLLVPLTLALVIARVDFGTRLMPDQVDQVHLAMWIHAGGFAIFALAAVRLRRATAVGIGRARLVLLACVLAGLVSLDRFAGIAFPSPSRYQGICQPHPMRA
jgi:membrane associated rhomboid family serine protease